jgi:hypothetical protein
MKYIMLAYTNAENWASGNFSPEDVQAACDFYEQLGKELTESGEAVFNAGLGDPTYTRTIRKTNSGTVVSDGPYAEVKEVLVSFGIVDCASLDRALEVAARVTDAVGDTVEVRPLMDDDMVADALS